MSQRALPSTWVPRHHACQIILPLLLSHCHISLLLPEQRRPPAPKETRQQLNPLKRRDGIRRERAEPRVDRATAAVVVGVMAIALPEAMAFDCHYNDSSSNIPPCSCRGTFLYKPHNCQRPHSKDHQQALYTPPPRDTQGQSQE